MPAAVPLANAPVMTARACIAVLSVGLPVAAVFEAFNVAALGLRCLLYTSDAADEL